MNELRESVSARVGELKSLIELLGKDIRRASDLRTRYETELHLLTHLQRLYADGTSPKPPTGTAEAVAMVVEVSGVPSATRPLVYSTATETPEHPHTGEEPTLSSPKRGHSKKKGPKVVAITPWGRLILTPRACMFIAKFYTGNTKRQIPVQEVMNWYRLVKPNISIDTLRKSVRGILNSLTSKGILRRDISMGYSFVKPAPPIPPPRKRP